VYVQDCPYSFKRWNTNKHVCYLCLFMFFVSLFVTGMDYDKQFKQSAAYNTQCTHNEEQLIILYMFIPV